LGEQIFIPTLIVPEKISLYCVAQNVIAVHNRILEIELVTF
jgi:hypothetical protein